MDRDVVERADAREMQPDDLHECQAPEARRIFAASAAGAKETTST
jgi:hypothetical protein